MNLHYQSRSKKDPRRLPATKQLRCGVWEGQERTPPGGATSRAQGADPRGADRPPGPQPTITTALESPRPPPHRALPLPLPGGDRCGEIRWPRSRCRASTERRPSGAERGEKGVNPEVHRPPASRWEHRGNKSGPAKAGRRSSSRTATCCETCHFPTLPRPSPSLALAPPPFFLHGGTQLPSTLLTCQPRGRERRPLPRAHPATVSLARPQGALLTSGASWSRRSPGCERGIGCEYVCGVQSGGTGRRKGPGVCHFLRERGSLRPWMRAAGPGGSAHCEPAKGRGAEGPESKGGARLPDAESAVAAAPPPLPGGEEGAGPGGGGGRGARRHQAATLEPCVRRRHAHTCPPPLWAAPLADSAERARLNFPFILGPGGRARRRCNFPRRLSGTRAARPDPKARPRANCGRARSLPPLPAFSVASVEACRSGPSSAAWDPTGTSAGGPWGAL